MHIFSLKFRNVVRKKTELCGKKSQVCQKSVNLRNSKNLGRVEALVYSGQFRSMLQQGKYDYAPTAEADPQYLEDYDTGGVWGGKEDNLVK